MMLWTLATQNSLKQALMGCGVTSQLPCQFPSTTAGKSPSTSSREVMTRVDREQKPNVLLGFLILLWFDFYKMFFFFLQEDLFRNIPTSLAPVQHVAVQSNIPFTPFMLGQSDKQVRQA